MTGKVWFVGAGPGDPELLTLKGRRLLEEAGAILYAGSLVSQAATRFAPPGCEIHLEYQLAGVWYRAGASGAVALDDSATLLPLRLVFVGTTDLMPGLTLDDSVYTVRRFGTSFTHVSTELTLGSASTDIRVRALVEGFDANEHTCTVKIITGAGTVNPDDTLVTIVDAARGMRWLDARFTPDPGVSAYRVKLEGTTTDAQLGFHVAERYALAL